MPLFVNDGSHLGIIGKIAKLTLPDDESPVLGAQREAVLKSKHGCLRKWRIPYLHRILSLMHDLI